MKLFSSFGPNPTVVKAFLLQRGQTIGTIILDVANRESRKEPYISMNPAGGTPFLLFDDGRTIAESTAICEYLEEVLPGETLLGSTPEERAIARMWLRRVDIMFVQRTADGWRFDEGLEIARPYQHVIPQAAADLKLMADLALQWIDRNVGSSDFLAGPRMTIADILLFVWVEMGVLNGKRVDPALEWIDGWRKRMATQPLAAAIPAPRPAA